MNRNDLTHEQRIEAQEMRDENPDAFDIWLLDYMDSISETSNMIYKDFVYEYYIEKKRLKNIDIILGDESDMCDD